IGVAALVAGRRGPNSDRDAIVHQFREVKLAEPAWSHEEVLLRLRELERDRARADAGLERGKRRDGALRSLAEIEESERDLADRLETFARRIGLREPVGVDSLQWLLERIRRWQEANDAAHGAFAAAETARTQLVAQ